MTISGIRGEPTNDIGDLVEAVFRFTDSSGAPADPTAITFTQRDPTGAEITKTELDATNPVVGEWRIVATRPFDIPGVWAWRAAGTSGVIAAAEVSTRVRSTVFGS